MTISTPPSVYPLATKKGVAIPLDVAKPVTGVMNPSLAIDTSLSLPLAPNTFYIFSLYCSQVAEVVIQDGAANVSGTFYAVPDTIHELAAVSYNGAGTITLTNKGSKPAIGIMNQIERWAQLDNQNYGVTS